MALYTFSTDSVLTSIEARSAAAAAMKFAASERIAGVETIGDLLRGIADRGGHATITDDRGDIVAEIDPDSGGFGPHHARLETTTMTARDARFLISELLLIANVHDGDLARAVDGAVAMGSIEARPTSFTTAHIDGQLSISFRTPDGPKRFRLDVIEA